jgi:hypothetical protein
LHTDFLKKLNISRRQQKCQKNLKNQGKIIKQKNQTALQSGFYFGCPEQDSNLHTVTGTSPSSWRVYQFHHLGGIKAKGFRLAAVPRTGLEPAHHY